MIEHAFVCPYCFQTISFLLDTSERESRFVEDCEVCCNPIAAVVRFRRGGVESFAAERAQ